MMQVSRFFLGLTLTFVVGSQTILRAQSTVEPGVANSPVSSDTAVPALINFSGVVSDLNGRPIRDTAGVTFLLYKDAQGGAPLWMETQSVQPDKAGHYSVVLGSTTTHGLPQDLFASGEARWLGVQIEGQPEQSRVLLVAVPYALKAKDAETVGGMPASAFVLAGPKASSAQGPAPNSESGVAGSSVARQPSVHSSAVPPPAAISGTGTAGYLPDFRSASTLGNSAVFQTGASPTAKIGINTAAPTTALDVHGGAAIRGALVLPPTGIATASLTGGKNSQPLNMSSSIYVPSSKSAINQTFQWRVEPVNNDTLLEDANLSLLFGEGANPPVETGVSIDHSGDLTVRNLNTLGEINAMGQVNINNGPADNADVLVIGDSFTKGMRLRDTGTGVDLESIGVPLYVNYSTEQATVINPNGGAVYVDRLQGSGAPYALNIGAIQYGEQFLSAQFANDVYVGGSLQVQGSKNFRIDHPLDPANKYLTHAAIESSEVLNQYSGNVVLDDKGEARVQFPDWFAAINEDFRYQLTAVGAPGPNLYIAEEIKDNSFTIAGGKPGMKVSWLVNARRNDPFIKTHPIVVEQEKSARERGHYLSPDAYGATNEMGSMSPAATAAPKQ